ncbi:MAG: hypothetical protein Q4A42_05755 [Tissierellia bacterium]|nr:hypothetical protein [Tissierellia bacterium]
MKDIKNNKIERALGIYTKLMNGYSVTKLKLIKSTSTLFYVRGVSFRKSYGKCNN